MQNGVCFACFDLVRPRRAWDKDIPRYRSSGKIHVAPRRCTIVPVAPLVLGKILTHTLYAFSSALSAFSFADVDTYVTVIESTTGYTFTPFVRYFTSERLIIAHGKKGPTALVSLPKDTGKVGVKEIAKVLKRPKWDSIP